ncbi:barstar family protein [Kitasatospora azatica]|uniref:barstar family protein n=1 Tax=Kitasatospora azatica TaxID=58347 RepID=UPI000568DC47|nr:barstar family protein [Kitasatospora azatica]
MRVVIDGQLIRTESDVHDALSGPLDFGPYYGGNLNALWDRLSTDAERPVELIWEQAQASREALGAAKFGAICSVLRRAAREDAAFGRKERFKARIETESGWEELA